MLSFPAPTPAFSGLGTRALRGWRLLLVVAGVVLLALIGWRAIAQVDGDRGIPPIASTGDFEIGGITVNTTGKNATDARQNGWREAQRKAWGVLYARSNGGAEAPELPDSRIASMVSAVVVEEERIGPRRYVARLGVIFDRARAGEILGSVGGAQARSAPMLVVPVTFSGGVASLYETRTPWQRAWAEFRTAQSPIDYVRPSGSGYESLILNAGQMGRRSRSWWRVVLDEFGASSVVFPVARLERQYPGGPVKGTFTARFGPENDYLGSFTMTAESEEALPVMLARATQRLDRIYANALAAGRLGVDDTLDMQEQALDPAVLEALARDLRQAAAPSAPSPSQAPQPAPSAGSSAGEGTSSPQPAPSTPAIANYTVQVATPDPAAFDGALSAIRSVPGVQSATVGSTAIGGTSVVRVGYAGDLSDLAASLSARGWRVTQGSGALSISR
ncbi:heavy-metal-associated domain-containing protein [Croceicoccus hydrothermalis]|uniref:heavy-metal-associated domain-containing protein n=1 Tax=Croceicoccus hydrothermalis TaxID=2867964 RepID=UPI001EFBC2C3|nr:heavy-metal-associated domain-containing protein [Croceicoccus hydrothermalis]